MTNHRPVNLTLEELRILADYAATCASTVLPIFERDMPNDVRPREAVNATLRFVKSGKRSNGLRMSGLAAFKAASAATTTAAAEAARSATQAVGAAYLHPFADSLQVKHILGAAAHAARALELDNGDDQAVGQKSIQLAAKGATDTVRIILNRYPPAPYGGGRTGELLRELDKLLRN